jgi:hypothetical protein
VARSRYAQSLMCELAGFFDNYTSPLNPICEHAAHYLSRLEVALSSMCSVSARETA